MNATTPRTPRRLGTKLAWLAAIGLVATAALPIAGALGLGAQGGGTADALWGAHGALDAPPLDAAQAANGYLGADAHASASVDAQPAVDAATNAAMDAKAQAEAQAQAALRQAEDLKDSVRVGIDAKTNVKADAGAQGALDSSADTGLYGGAGGVIAVGAEKHVDAQPAVQAADQAKVAADAQVQAGTDLLGSLLAEAQAQLDMGVHAVMSLAGQAQAAVGSALGLVQDTHVRADASLKASTGLVGAAQLPQVEVPRLDAGAAGSMTATASAAAQGIVR